MKRVILGNRINAEAWAAIISDLQAYGIARGTASDEADKDIELDISKVRFADFPILGRLLILITKLTSLGANITIRMPNENQLNEEAEMLAQSQSNIERSSKERLFARRSRQRLNCRLYLIQAGFDTALQSGPLGSAKVKIIEGSSSPVQVNPAYMFNVEQEQQEAFQEPQRSRRILSYRWLDLESYETRGDIREIGNIENTLRAIGVPSHDAAAITRGILAELIENVVDHASTNSNRARYALVGASLVQAKDYGSRIHDFDEDTQDFALRASHLPAQILQMSVGDAGQGIEGPILAALDHHSSSRPGSSGPKGLWKVKEMTRSFNGTVMVLTRHAVGGYIFDPVQSERSVSNPSPYPFPGTMIECNILSTPGRDPDPRVGDALSAARQVSTISLPCETAMLRSGIGIDARDREAIESRLGELSHTPDWGLVIAIDIPPEETPPNDRDIHKAIKTILDIAGNASQIKAIAVAFAGISNKLLSVAVLDLNLQYDIESRQQSTLSGPILVVSPRGGNYWVGGTPTIRRLLSHLSQTNTPQKLTDFARGQDVHTIEQLTNEIRAYSHLLHLDDEFVRLNLRRQDVIIALISHVGREISQTIANEQALQDHEEFFLTPTLRLVKQWIDLPNLLQNMKCHRMAGFLLAAGLDFRMVTFPTNPPPLVVRVGSIEEHIASGFASSLTGLEETFDEIALLPRSAFVQKQSHQQWVIICTDIISNGASVRKAIRDLWSLGFAQVAVATVLDARDIEGKRESRDDITVHGQSVPLFSLASISVGGQQSPDGEERRRLIDPVIGKPIPQQYARSKTIVHQEAYKKAIVRSGAARLGHIRRSSRRHYNAYIDMKRLFKDQDWAKIAFRAMIKAVKLDNDSAQIGTGNEAALCVIFPGWASDDFGLVARELTRAMRDSDLRCVDPVPVARAVLGNDWIFPRTIQLKPEVRHVVAIDSSSKTGTTLRNFMRLSAQSNVGMISCFSIVNGMTDVESMTLQQIRSVLARPTENPRHLIGVDVPVNVRFLVRTAATATDPSSCSACSLRASYASLPASLPASLTEQRDWLMQVLDARSREHVFADEAMDLFGMAVLQEDCISYLLWRSYLAEAALDTESRETVAAKLTNLAEQAEALTARSYLTRDRNALVRLLAAEPNRLELAPLWFTSVRAKIVALVQSLIKRPGSLTADPVLRVQALMVLARADVRIFASDYGELVRQSQDHPLVLGQALIEAVRLINDRSGTPDWFRSLADQIFTLSHESNMADWSAPTWNVPRPAEDLQWLAAMVERQESS